MTADNSATCKIVGGHRLHQAQAEPMSPIDLISCLGSDELREYLREVSDRFSKSQSEINNVGTALAKVRRKFRMSGPLWQKPDGNSQCRDRFSKSQTTIHNIGTALAKGSICEETAGQGL